VIREDSIMTTNVTAGIIIGSLFLLTGLIACFVYKWRKFKGYIPLVLGLFLVYIYSIGPLSDDKKRINELTHLKNTEIVSIVLQPTRYKGYENISMYNFDNLITDRRIIDSFCIALNTAVIVDEGYLKNPESACRIQINMRDKKTIAFGVRKSGTAICLIVNSRGEYGWHYANLKANSFGHWLDNFGN
jgi:hypothetical protein